MDVFDIRNIEIEDLDSYFYWKKSYHEHNKLNGPYYKRDNDEDLRIHIDNIRKKLKNGITSPIDDKRVVVFKNSNKLVGEVNWYWKSRETYWMEIGIVIFDKSNWGKGYGINILKKWIDMVFDEQPRIIRIGLSTWSGNFGMLKLAEKIGMTRAAVYRKARIVNGEYYDSISYGLLKEEWINLKKYFI